MIDLIASLIAIYLICATWFAIWKGFKNRRKK
jgi:hypothetical protein